MTSSNDASGAVADSDASRRAPAREILVDNGKTLLTLDELARLQPGMDRMMAEIGERARRLYYAADAQAWEAADYFSRTLGKHLRSSAVSRPKYQQAMEAFLDDDYAPLRQAVVQRDRDAFMAAWDHLVVRVNDYHVEFGVGYLRYRTPTEPPSDLDFGSTGADRA